MQTREEVKVDEKQQDDTFINPVIVYKKQKEFAQYGLGRATPGI